MELFDMERPVLSDRGLATADPQGKQGGVPPNGETPEKVIPITRPKALLNHIYTISGVIAVIQPHRWWNRRKKPSARARAG